MRTREPFRVGSRVWSKTYEENVEVLAYERYQERWTRRPCHPKGKTIVYRRLVGTNSHHETGPCHDPPECFEPEHLPTPEGRVRDAAPDLLAALEALTDPEGHIWHGNNPDATGCTGECREARAAIAKARGQ